MKFIKYFSLTTLSILVIQKPILGMQESEYINPGHQETVIEDFLENRDLPEIQSIIDKIPSLSQLYGSSEEQTSESRPARPKSPPLTILFKNESKENTVHRLGLKTVIRSFAKVLRLKETTIGFICFSSMLTQKPQASSESIGSIACLGVHPDYKRKGYHEKLVRYAIEILRSESFPNVIEASFKREDQEAKELFERLQFKQRKTDDPVSSYCIYCLDAPCQKRTID